MLDETRSDRSASGVREFGGYMVESVCLGMKVRSVVSFISILICCLLLVTPQSCRAASPMKRPNIIFVVCDDLGFADVGFNANEFNVPTDVVTPHLDDLARNGMIFTDAYVPHPFCGPSRMGMLSGRMPHTFGGQKNLPNFSQNLRSYNSKGIPVSETLISKLLQQTGYSTACIGKWHLGYAEAFHPLRRGFDEFLGFLGGGHQYYPSVSDQVEPKVNDYQYFLQNQWEDWRSPQGAYLTDLLSERASKFVTTKASEKQPFFLYLAYNAPHSPLQGKTEDLRQLFPMHSPSNPGNGVDYRDYENRQNYVAMIYAVDRGIGQLVQTLKDPNGDGSEKDSILNETLIVFLSDNGGKILQAGNNAPLQDDKGSTHEGGIRVPMMMHWPGHLPANSVFRHPVLALDLYPTFSGLAEATIPKTKELDGKDIWSCLGNNQNPHQDETLYWLRHHGVGNEVAIRRNHLKAYRKNFAFWQVFNLSEDLGEQNNIAAEHDDFLAQQIMAAQAWSGTHVDPLWHDTEASFQSWVENRMPRYDETFRVRRPAAKGSK